VQVERLVFVVLLSLLGLTFACNAPLETCDDGYADHCDGATAVTCEHRYSNGSGFQLGGDPIRRETCSSGVCGKSCYCAQDCDVCKSTLHVSVSCDPDPASCEQSCGPD
jgi:hypothetical protein